LTSHRDELIAMCRAKVATRLAPRPTECELEHGIRIFLDQLVEALRLELSSEASMGATATKHGGELLRHGFTVAQVVHDYGDACQSITELAIAREVAIATRPRSHVFLRAHASGDHVFIDVEDESGGLLPGKQDELFAPFSQRSADRSGLGLGLTISLRGARALGGDLRVRDLPGQGCVFSVELPRPFASSRTALGGAVRVPARGVHRRPRRSLDALRGAHEQEPT
jgi:Histidine kinase-, DNA gyrase B-, and HSP90-like ATPase